MVDTGKMNSSKTIALVDWVWEGHHPLFYKLFLRALLELGCTVLAICPEPDEVSAAISDLPSEPLSRVTFERGTWASALHFVPERFQHRLGTTRTIRAVAKSIRRWEIAQKKSVDLVFFACIYNLHFSGWKEAEWSFPYSWSGLFLFSGKFRRVPPTAGWSDLPPNLMIELRSPRMKSLAVLDEGVTQIMERLCERPVVTFPDVSDVSFEESSPMMLKLKRFAAGAPIIGSLGFLKRSKGILTLARLALNPANSDLCFAFIGQVDWPGYDPEEQNLISMAIERCPNVYAHFSRIRDEGTFNACIRVCDVIFAAYLNFADSSGILSKAAVFERPIIVSEGFVMAERVRKYHLGEVIPGGDVEAASRAIRKLLKQGSERVEPPPDWEGYREEHSYQRLKTSFSEILSAN
jgi:glycosyltransferase involved in cell wall biosynthesis